MKQTHDLELATLYAVSKILTASLVNHDVLRQVINVIAVQLDMEQGVLSLVQPSGKLEVIAGIGLSVDEMRLGVFQSGEGVIGRVFKHAIPIVISDISTEPELIKDKDLYQGPDGEVISFLGVPIKAGNTCLGVLAFKFKQKPAFSGFESLVRFLTMIAGMIGQSIRLNMQVMQDRQHWLSEKADLQKALMHKYGLPNVIGQSKSMREVFAEVHLVAPTNATVLLRGESGTGKELIARAIHMHSTRKMQPFIKVNCAALSEHLLESELFGHEKGAFTGAIQERKGRFEQADGGTLFLDEIGEISPSFQAKLLRVLQEREFERVGGNKTIRVNVRLISATNRNLEEAVSNGTFRADLYYRINVVGVMLPPLRERREDIPLLVERVLMQHNIENKKHLQLTAQALRVLINCSWPGNVRQLENCVTRIATMARSDFIHDTDIPCQSQRCFSPLISATTAHNPDVIPIALENFASGVSNGYDKNLMGYTLKIDRAKLIEIMESVGWVQAKAARVLGLTPRQVGYALKKYAVEIKKI